MTGIGPIDQSLLPADIRQAGKSAQQRYASALSFEQMLTQQLTQQLADSATSGDTGDGADGDTGGQDATSNYYQQMLPDVMAQAVTDAGGLGLARQLYDGMTEQSK